jgi:UDP-N-acetylmuramate dehydrogenase
VAEVNNKKALRVLLEHIKALSLRFFIVGSGTNILFSDQGFDGVVIKLTGSFDEIVFQSGGITCGGGAEMSTVLKMAAENSYGGLEFMAGIPGTVGGAVMGNAGMKDKWISESIEEVEVMDSDGETKVLKREAIVFYYRKSALGRYIILNVKFRLEKGDRTEILKNMYNIIEEKKQKQPLMYPNAGCIFKNPSESVFAGKLIDEAGLKGLSVGGAKISERHANFIVNTGAASSGDVLRLIEKIKTTVKHKYDVDLDVEIKVVM